VADFFPATVRANRWRGELFALPWFADVGMLYYRTDLVPRAPATFAELVELAERGRGAGARFGFVWQGARYEGLVCVFLEHLAGFGGEILDGDGRVVVDGAPGIRALTFMRDAIHESGVVPEAALNWQEEQTRYAFQNGEAVFLRNWPYAWPLMQDAAKSRVAGRFAVGLLPSAPGGSAGAALGGSQLAINTNTEHPEAAWRVLRFLTAPEQMLERAAVLGQFPPRVSLYEHPELALPIPAGQVRALIEHATPRPVSPVWAELSEILQVGLHRALTRQAEPEDALRRAAADLRATLERAGLSAR
jgi:multiple sugar transport system substrate-binding protein